MFTLVLLAILLFETRPHLTLVVLELIGKKDLKLSLLLPLSYKD